MVSTLNVEVDQMLETSWTLFGEHFSKIEVGIKQEFVDKHWPEEK